MSLYNRSLYARPDPTFTNLFRLLDDFASYSHESSAGGVAHRSFNPKFDVRETETAYEFHGELPGITRESLTIEFTEPQTLSIRGRIERNYTAGTPPAAAIEDAQMSGAITADSASHQASVSDEETEAAKEKGEATAPTQVTEAKPSPRKERYWHQERSIGEFHRTFSFPARVDEEAVSANLDRGVLHITVPKATKRESHRVTIN